MFLSRPHFDIHDGSSETLDDLAEFTMQLFDYLPDANHYPPRYSLSLNLYGVQQGQLCAVQKELESRLEPRGFKTNLLGPPGACSVTTDEAEFNIKPVSGLGVSQLEGKPFDGLVLELRFTIRARNSAIVEIDSTLVLEGELKSGRLEIRAVWREGSQGDPNKGFQSAQWAQEGQFWSLFQEFQDDDLRETKETLNLAQHFFANARWERRFAAILGEIIAPFRTGKSRSWALFIRGFQSSLLALVGVYAVTLLVANKKDSIEIYDMCFWVMSLGLFCPLLLFLAFEIYVARTFWRGFSNQYYPLYRQESHLTEARPETVLEHTSNCYYQQVAEELRDHGYRLLGHQEMMLGSKSLALLSMFVNDHDCTDVCLLTKREDPFAFEKSGLHHWPVIMTVATRSKFSDGSLNIMINSFSDAWRRVMPGNVRTRYWSNIEDLEQHLQKHTQWCEEYTLQHGVSRVARNYDEIVQMHKDRLKQDYEFYHKKPFTLGDFLNFYLQRTRWAYRF